MSLTPCSFLIELLYKSIITCAVAFIINRVQLIEFASSGKALQTFRHNSMSQDAPELNLYCLSQGAEGFAECEISQFLSPHIHFWNFSANDS